MNKILWISLIMSWVTNILLVLLLFFMLNRFIPSMESVVPLKETVPKVEEPL